MEAVEFNQLLPEFAELGVRVVGASIDPLERLERFRAKHEIGFPFISDAGRAVGDAYGTFKSEGGTHERDTVVIARDGRIVAAYRKARAQGHAAQVLADIRRLREEAEL